MIFLRYVVIFHFSSSVLINIENMFKDLSRSFCTCSLFEQNKNNIRVKHPGGPESKAGFIPTEQAPSIGNSGGRFTVSQQGLVAASPVTPSVQNTVGTRPQNPTTRSGLTISNKPECQRCPNELMFSRIGPIDEDKQYEEYLDEYGESMLM